MSTKTDTTILECIIPRLVPNPNGPSYLGLEVTDGPYEGVVFSFHKFKVLDDEAATDGMVRTQFETHVHAAPKGFQTDDEGFDAFARDVLIAWLGYLSEHADEMKLLMAENSGVVH